jgi:hypothetical protein
LVVQDVSGVQATELNILLAGVQMQSDLITYTSPCPYCGETIDVVVEPSFDDQHTIEDCSVCCRPIEVLVSTDVDGGTNVVLRHENEV